MFYEQMDIFGGSTDITNEVIPRNEIQRRLKYTDLVDPAERLAHWIDIFNNGCSDPFWCDGVNMNLARNHIIYANRCMETYLLKTVPVPPKVPDGYMAVERRCFCDCARVCKEEFLNSLSPDEIASLNAVLKTQKN